MKKIIIAALLYTLLFSAVEVATKMAGFKKELSRKFVHIVAGVTAALLPYFMSFHEIFFLSLLFIPVMLLSKQRKIFTSIHHVSRQTYGEIYFPLSLAFAAVVFPVRALFMYGILVMALSDGFASVIGQAYGQKKYSLLGSEKSFVGSLTFFVMTLVLGVAALSSVHASLPVIIMSSLILAGVLTAIEGALSYGLDNLILPPVAAYLLWLVLRSSKLG